MAEVNAADVADNPVIATPVAENEEDTEDWRIQAEAFKSEGRLLCDLLKARLTTAVGTEGALLLLCAVLDFRISGPLSFVVGCCGVACRYNT